MKLCYWDIKRYAAPHHLWRWAGSKLVRIVGNKSPQDVSNLSRYVDQFIEHTFLIFSNNVHDFDITLPINMIPVLQISDKIDLQYKLDRYFSLKVPYYCVSIEAENYIKLPVDVPVDWYFISGRKEKYDQMMYVTGNLMSLGTPLYVEKYNLSPNLPDEFNIRDFPENLSYDFTHSLAEPMRLNS